MSFTTTELPIGWALITLGEIVEVLRGVTYTKQDALSELKPGLVPILRATNINGELDFDELVYVPEKYVSSGQFLIPNDIIVAASSGSRSAVGKAAQLKSEWTGSFGAFCYVVRPDRGVDSRLIALYMQTSEYRHRIGELSAGVNINNLRREHISSFHYPFPPLNEQQKIVAEIEKHFTRLDAAVAALKRVQANLKRYRAAVLKAACEGRLVPTEAELSREEGRSYETGEQLLARILKERRAKWEADQLAKTDTSGKPSKNDDWKKKYKEPQSPDISGAPVLPDGWTYATVNQLTTSKEGMTTGPFGTLINKTDQRADGIPVAGIPNITDKGFVPGSWFYVTPEKARELSRYALRNYDVVLSRSGTVGEACVIPQGYEPLLMSTNLMRMRTVGNGFLAAWLVLNFKGNETIAGQLEQLCKGSTRAFVNLEILSILLVRLAPTTEQERVREQTDRVLSAVDSIDHSTQLLLARANRLRQSILKRAFEGKLVPQDPNDEAASVLLEHIRAERASAPSLRQVGKKYSAKKMREVMVTTIS